MSQSEKPSADSAALAVTTGDVVGWQWAAPSPASATPAAPAAPAASTRVGEAAPARYQPLHLLGKGGMGEVMLCRDGVIRREVAMKRILPSRADDPETRARFLNEAQIQGQLEHPAIVPVYDLSVSADGSIFFTMKRLRGRTLENILDGLRAGRAEDLAAFPRYRLLQALASVCQAISFAHGRGVLHRDLKPANVTIERKTQTTVPRHGEVLANHGLWCGTCSPYCLPTVPIPSPSWATAALPMRCATAPKLASRGALFPSAAAPGRPSSTSKMPFRGILEIPLLAERWS